jgi:methionyl-tRNA formyltransferase
MEVREAMIPQPPDRVSDLDRDNFIRHFKNRDLAEEKYFGSQPKPDFPLLEVRKDTLNEQESVEFVKQVNPDLVLIFGSGLVKEPLFSVLPEDKINLHLGLSPRYRGAATLFWPFYFMEPTYAGTTFHYIVSEPDAGKIIHQVVPPLDPEDGIHDVACKAVIQSTKDAIKLLEIYQFKGAWKQHKQRSTGKNFLSSDFKPEHLRVIYNVFDDDMVRRYLEGKLISKQPQLFRQY